MPRFLFIYHGGKAPETPEQQEAEMAAWGAWYDDMGEAVVDPGNPVGLSMTVDAQGVHEGGGSNPAAGWTVVQAETLEDACALAQGCPEVKKGTGSVEVAPVIEL